MRPEAELNRRDLECEIYLIDALIQMSEGVPVSDLKPRLSSKQVKEIVRQVNAEQRPMLP